MVATVDLVTTPTGSIDAGEDSHSKTQPQLGSTALKIPEELVDPKERRSG
mgnify:CR=1 FL=1